MAEDAVVRDQLTEGMIEAGARLTSKLDEIGLPVTAAFWFLEPDLNEWRLLFASQEVNAHGPRAVYERIGRAVDELGATSATVPLSNIGVLDADADLVRLLKEAARNGTGGGRVRFSKSAVNGHFIDDALIYRAA
jgi:hypothetical protein